MGFLESLAPTLPSGFAVGTLFYMVGAAVQVIAPSVNPFAAFAVGFSCAVAVGLKPNCYEEE